MKVIIDRFEGEYALVELENREIAALSRQLVPGAKEGDVIEIRIDPAARRKREAEIDQLMGEVFE
ncbi:DUF3006 family protein [Hydrogenispora ethanolica]|uniref:DUF3006 family protein n=1 Tax=Hydrogenispora ethanolica TaxID=1082276 RepID=A0A4R1RD41_HYDET|nr:DUF3006 domain-containing protein [Hydrogenispora ethanolica]TCL63785.1 DUF3006 family protein [Hydrogenispora ethanolica]